MVGNMRVLVLGIAGMEKRKYIDKVADVAYRENFVSGRANPLSKGFIEIYDLDGTIKKELGGLPKYAAYLDNPNPQIQQEIWDRFCQVIIKEVERDKPKHVFLLTHGTYYRNKRYFSRLNWNVLRKFKPSVIITLIDDSYEVKRRIAEVESKLETRSECSFSEAIEWRTVEIMESDILSENLYEQMKIPHFVLAIKHPPETVYRLLFEKWRLILYTAFPIGITRSNDDAILEINNFRKKLSQHFTVFDPVTIDEYPLAGNSVKRWPLDNADTQLSLKIGEIKSIEKAILENIEARDFRYVNQSDGLVAYRPFWGKRQSPSRGVDREMIQALNQNKAIYVVHSIDDGVIGPRQKLFEPIAKAQAIKSSDEEIVNELLKWQEQKKSLETHETRDS
jgi:adenylate kinase